MIRKSRKFLNCVQNFMLMNDLSWSEKVVHANLLLVIFIIIALDEKN